MLPAIFSILDLWSNDLNHCLFIVCEDQRVSFFLSSSLFLSFFLACLFSFLLALSLSISPSLSLCLALCLSLHLFIAIIAFAQYQKLLNQRIVCLIIFFCLLSCLS